MSQSQELSPTVLAAQKAVLDNKQTVSIRKVTIESIAPVIAKVEQHIAYLIDQTSNLRQQNSNLLSAQANQRALQDQIIAINKSLQTLSSNINAFNRDKQSKQLGHAKELEEIRDQMQQLKKDASLRDKKIEEIDNKNEMYLEEISKSKHQQSQIVEGLRSHLEQYYEQQIMKINAIDDKVQDIKISIASMSQQRCKDQQQISKLNNVMTLYEIQRQDIKKLIDRTAFLQNNMVMLSEYEQFKQYNKIDIALIKSDVKAMLDQALTPEIRKFLPILIRKLDQLNSFQTKLAGLYTQLQQQQHTHRQVIQTLKQEWSEKFSQYQTKNHQTFNSIKANLQNEVSKIIHIQENNQQIVLEKLKSVEEDVSFNKKLAEINLQESVQKLWRQNKEYIYNWGESFIDRKKTEIYNIVQSVTPKQKVDEQKKIFELVYSMQPLVREANSQLQSSKHQLQIINQSLNEKLSLFSNQIVKFKSDINREMIQERKVLQSLNRRLKGNQEFGHQISQLLSKLLETSIVMYSLSLDQRYLGQEKQVYVTYNDGILMEVQENNDLIKYRRKTMNCQLLKRAVLKQYAKLVDQIIINQPLIGWEQKQSRPSSFFEAIHKSYQQLYEENKANIDQMSPKHQESGQTKERVQQYASTQYGMPKISSRNKAGTNFQKLSRTIEFQSKETRRVLNTPRYDIDREAGSSNRKSIRLKKMDKKE